MGFLFLKTMYLFEHDNTYYAYSFLKNTLLKINSEAYRDAKRNEQTDRLQNLMKTWTKMGFFKEDLTAAVKLHLPQLQFSFSPVHECNMRCKYCFADHGKKYKGIEREITKEMVDRILDFVFWGQFQSFTDYRIDFVSGGEPLLNFDIIHYTIEQSKKLLENTNKRLSIFLVTNGTINNPEIFEYLDKNNVNIGISIDGDSVTHNNNRRFADGSPSYKTVINTINSIRESSSSSSRIKDLWGLSVITSESKNLAGIIEHHKALQIKHMQMELVRACKDLPFSINERNLTSLISEYAELTNYFLNEIRNGRLDSLKMILNDNDYFGKILCRIIDGGRMYYRCTAGIGKFNFDASGNIFPCEFLAGDPRYCVGNIDSGINEGAITQYFEEHVDKRPLCNACWARYICGGDCYSNSLLVNNNIYLPDECFCKVNKSIIEFALILVFAMKEKGIYDACKKFVHMRKVLSTVGGYESSIENKPQAVDATK